MWFAKTKEEVIEELQVNASSGLTSAEVETRQAQYGKNKLRKSPRKAFSRCFRPVAGYVDLCSARCGRNYRINSRVR